jgi:hypothetical protein
MPAVPPGRYTLTVEAPGFRKAEQQAFELEVQQQATFNMQLSVGEVSTAVDVQGVAPLINTTSAPLGQDQFREAFLLDGSHPAFGECVPIRTAQR